MAKTNLEKTKEDNKEYYDRNRRVKETGIRTGDTVICKQEKKNKITPKFDSKHYTVVQQKYNMVAVKIDYGKTVMGNVSFFKKVFMDKSEDKEEEDIKRQETDQVPKQEPSLRRSTRIKKPLNRYEHRNWVFDRKYGQNTYHKDIHNIVKRWLIFERNRGLI